MNRVSCAPYPMAGLRYDSFDAADLATFARLQRAVFAALEEVAGTLRAGDTERAVARRLHRVLRAAGASAYFHVPVALFGERTTYPGDFGAFGALATETALRDGDAVILDAAPVIDGFTIDAALTLRFGSDGVPQVLDETLADLRRRILEGVQAGREMREIARNVDDEIRRRGLKNCHRQHIGAVLGHRITKAPGAFLRGRRIWGLAPRQAAWFLTRSAVSSLGRPDLTPNWNAGRQSACPVPDGLWAIEPHVAEGKFGAKFEEILLVQGGEARYLDDALPHHHRWQGRPPAG